jgi:hypothetical protein
MKCLRSLGPCDRGFESNFRHEYSVCVLIYFMIFFVLHLGRGLVTGRSLFQGVLRFKEKLKP